MGNLSYLQKQQGVWFTHDLDYAKDMASGAAEASEGQPAVVAIRHDLSNLQDGSDLSADSDVEDGYDGIDFGGNVFLKNLQNVKSVKSHIGRDEVHWL